MADSKEYMKRKEELAREDARFLNTEQGKAFIKRRINPAFNQQVNAPDDFSRGVQEGERNLARIILNIFYIGNNDE